MSDANEMVNIEMEKEPRTRLRHAVVSQMVRLGYDSLAWESLKLGFEMPAGWPDDEGSEITFSQLVVLARKLKMQIVIRDLRMRTML